jgi:hypothetical protein
MADGEDAAELWPAAAAGDASPLNAGDPPALAPLCACVRTLIAGVGEDASREGLVDTPKVRAVAAWCDRPPRKHTERMRDSAGEKK